MISYKFSKQINPKHHYFNINFNDIKSSLAITDKNTIDYISIIAIKREDYFFTVDRLGQITIHYNDISNEEIESVVVSVDDIFNQYNFVMDYQLDSCLN